MLRVHIRRKRALSRLLPLVFALFVLAGIGASFAQSGLPSESVSTRSILQFQRSHTSSARLTSLRWISLLFAAPFFAALVTKKGSQHEPAQVRFEGHRIGDIIQRARSRKGLSQKELARAADVTPAYISRIENGDSVPSDELCKKLADHLGLDDTTLRTQALIGREGEGIKSLLSARKTSSLRSLEDDERELVEEFRRLDSIWRRTILDFTILANERKARKPRRTK